MKIIKSIPEACCKNGEDYWAGSYHNYFLVLDGASGLHKDIIHKEGIYKDNTDAQWFVQRFANLIKSYVDTVVPVKELVTRCISELKSEYTSLIADSAYNTSFYEPSASMALMKRTGDIFELLVMGDITVLIKDKAGKVESIFDDSVQKLDQQALSAAGKLAEEKGFDFIDAVQQEPIKRLLAENRNKRSNMNKTGYCILGLQEEVVNDAVYVRIDESSIRKILICSDGFAAYYDKYKLAVDDHALMKAAEKQTFSRMLNKIRSTEKKDAKCNSFPRFKVSDDATAILLVGGADKGESRKQTLWTKANIIFFRIVGKCQSAFMAFGLKKSYIATILVALATIVYSLLTLFINGAADTQANVISPSNTSTYTLDILSKIPLMATIFTTLATLVSTIYEYRSFSRAYLILANKNIKENVLTRLKLSPKQIENGYHIQSFFNGEANESYIISREVNSHLRDTMSKSAIKIGLLNNKFMLTDEVAKLVPSIMNLNFRKPSITFNGKLLRQISDLYPGISSVDVQKTAYFDGQCTHEIVYKQFKSFHDIKLTFDGSQLLMDQDNVLYDLDYSSCANFIGVSTLVFTKDNRIIIGKQAGYSKANSGRYAPSGSGSVNYSDVMYVTKKMPITEILEAKYGEDRNEIDKKDFRNILAYAMMREFCEECNYLLQRAKQKMQTRIIGYVRLLERGGKPDYFGISYIDEDIFDLSNDIRKREYGLSSHYDFCYFSDVQQIPIVLRNFCTGRISDKKISIQLNIICDLLEQLAKENKLALLIDDMKTAASEFETRPEICSDTSSKDCLPMC